MYSAPATRPYTLQHRWSVMHNYLAGITTGTWWRLLQENHFKVDWTYAHRAAFISATSLMNSFYRAREERRFAGAIEKVTITQPPLFILGHWRSGTTLLHYLLAQDTEQFSFPNTYQVVNPHTFLTTEEKNKRRFAHLVPDKRPMDNMALSFDTPQEDEFGPLLICLRSPYLGISFPRHESRYLRYLSFQHAPPEDQSAWERAFVLFLKKLTWKSNRSLLLKSPPHTARIRILLKLFPNARFIHLHRDPYRVFQSTQHYFDTAMWYTYLQRPDCARIDEGILQRYTLLYDAFFEDRKRVPDHQFHELSFEDLERDPIREVRLIYDRFKLAGWSAFEPNLRSYLASLSGYQKNQFSEMPSSARRRVAQEWARSFDAWGYST